MIANMICVALIAAWVFATVCYCVKTVRKAKKQGGHIGCAGCSCSSCCSGGCSHSCS